MKGDSKKGKKAADDKAKADGRSARAIAMYAARKSTFKSIPKAAEEIAPTVGLSVEVVIKHLRAYEKKPDSAMQNTDSALMDNFGP